MQAYHSSLRLQNQVAENRIRFSQRLNEMSDELLALAREGEKLRKLVSCRSYGAVAQLTRSTRRMEYGIRTSCRKAK